MEFKMHLKEKPFFMIKSGKKDIEMRLYDEKRQKIQGGDAECQAACSDPVQEQRCRPVRKCQRRRRHHFKTARKQTAVTAFSFPPISERSSP